MIFKPTARTRNFRRTRKIVQRYTYVPIKLAPYYFAKMLVKLPLREN